MQLRETRFANFSRKKNAKHFLPIGTKLLRGTTLISKSLDTYKYLTRITSQTTNIHLCSFRAKFNYCLTLRKLSADDFLSL